MKTIPGFSRYLASADGHIYRALDLYKLKARKGRGGYLQTCLQSDTKKEKTVLVHRMVAMAYHCLPSPGQQVRHLNGTPADSRAENLAWGTATENQHDRRGHGTRPRFGENSRQSVLSTKQVEAMRQIRSYGGITLKCLAAQFGVSLSEAHGIVSNQRRVFG